LAGNLDGLRWRLLAGNLDGLRWRLLAAYGLCSWRQEEIPGGDVEVLGSSMEGRKRRALEQCELDREDR
jgi:hypothetical protein